LKNCVVFLNTEMLGHIQSAGWREWHPGETNRLDTVFFAEYNSSGPGARMSERDPHTKKLSAQQPAGFDTRRFLVGSDGWNPMQP
jgi:hypothetical protein